MDELTVMLDQLAEYNAARDALTLQKQELIDSVITPEIRAKLAEIDAEFAPMVEAVTAQAAELEAKIREGVIRNGSTVKGAHLMAVYNKPRVSWDSKKLDGMMALVPGLAAARKEGEPSVSIRKV